MFLNAKFDFNIFLILRLSTDNQRIKPFGGPSISLQITAFTKLSSSAEGDVVKMGSVSVFSRGMLVETVG